MIEKLKFITTIVNYIHDKLIILTKLLGLKFSDKQLHFLVIGLLGIGLFLLVNKLFKFLVRYSIKAIAFIYTFTVLIVITFAIEIEQKLTGRGNMEFQDIAQGLWGFIVAFVIYLGIIGLVFLAKKARLHRR